MSDKSEQNEKGFDPNRFLIKLPKRTRLADGSWKTVDADYLEVKWRLLWLRTEHPDAIIETKLVSHGDETAVFRARVSVPNGGSASGWGHETAADFGDYLEKAETKALGRALAALGYGTQFCEDFEFEQVEPRRGGPGRIVDAPVERTGTRGGAAASNITQLGDSAQRGAGSLAGAASPVLLATEPQVKAIYAIARGTHAMDDEELDAHCRERYGCTPHELTRRQASEFIDSLKLGAAGRAS